MAATRKGARAFRDRWIKMPTNEKCNNCLLFAMLDVINVLISFSFLKLCSALVTVTTHFVNSRSKASEHLLLLK